MNNDSIFYDSDRFDAVWKRVLDSSSSHVGQDSETVLEFMRDEYCDWQLYNALAKISRGDTKQIFSQAARDEQRHFKALRTQHYILTGRAYSPGNDCPTQVTSPISAVLRSRYEGESAGAAAYLAAADRTSRADLRQMYLRFSSDEARHSRQILKLINRIIG